MTLFVGGALFGYVVDRWGPDYIDSMGLQMYAYGLGLIVWLAAVLFQPRRGAGRLLGCAIGIVLLFISIFAFCLTSPH